MINGVNIDNRWIVPYNAILSRTFETYINVEFCNSVKLIKYIRKYINNRSDQAIVTIENLGELTRYETGRYISTSEAVRRILSFLIHERFSSVMHRAINLANGRRVYFTDDNAIDEIDYPPETTL